MDNTYDPFDFELADEPRAEAPAETAPPAEAARTWDDAPASSPFAPGGDGRTNSMVDGRPSMPTVPLDGETAPDHNSVLVEVDEDLEDLIPDFMENRRKEIERMTYALDAGDFSTIQAGGHVMKGSGGGYGFDYVTEIGAELENLARASDAQGIRSRLEALSDYLDRVEIVYI